MPTVSGEPGCHGRCCRRWPRRPPGFWRTVQDGAKANGERPTRTSDETLNAQLGIFPASPNAAGSRSPPPARAERQIGHARRKVQSDRALDREGLKHDASAGTSDEHVSAETGAYRDATACAHIAPAQRAGSDTRVPRKNGPGEASRTGHTKIETDAPDPALVYVLPRGPARREHATKFLRRPEHESDAGRAGAHEPADPERLGSSRRGDGGAYERGCADARNKHDPSHSSLRSVSGMSGRAVRIAVPAEPERDA